MCLGDKSEMNLLLHQNVGFQLTDQMCLNNLFPFRFQTVDRFAILIYIVGDLLICK